jgi:hypothetical protein
MPLGTAALVADDILDADAARAKRGRDSPFQEQVFASVARLSHLPGDLEHVPATTPEATSTDSLGWPVGHSTVQANRPIGVVVRRSEMAQSPRYEQPTAIASQPAESRWLVEGWMCYTNRPNPRQWYATVTTRVDVESSIDEYVES